MKLATCTLSLAATLFLWAFATESVASPGPIGSNHDDHRQLQADNRVKVFQEKNKLVVIEAESVDRRPYTFHTPQGRVTFYSSQDWKFESNNTKRATSIVDYVGSGYLRFNVKNITNTTLAGSPTLTTSLVYYINITNPGEYRLSIRSYKDSANPSANVEMVNFPGVLGTKVKTFLPGASYEWGYRTLLELNDAEEIPIYAFPVRGTYRFVISGRTDASDYLVDRLVFYDNAVHTAKSATNNSQGQSKFIVTKPPGNALSTPNVQPMLPLLLPNFASTQQLPEYTFNTGIVNETTVYDEANVAIYGQSKIYNDSQYDVIVLPEWKRPYSTVSSMFRSHRSGALSFAYEYSNLYPPGTFVNVTLGFVENYPIICNKQRSRVFNITVNGQPYVSSLNVFGTVGCHVALLLSKQFQINKSGKIVINFSSVKQYPMISFIGIDSNEASSSVQMDSISDTPSTIPSDAPSDISSTFPSDAPSDISSTFPSDAPSDISSTAPSDSPSSILSDTPSDSPSGVISDVPSSAPSDAPSDIPSDAPSSAPLPIIGLNLVESESGAFVSALHDGDSIERSTLGLTKNLTIVAVTLDTVETVRFVYDGITHIEGVAPYAMFGKSSNGNKFWPVQYLSTNGLKTLKVDAYDITHTKSIDEVVMEFSIV